MHMVIRVVVEAHDVASAVRAAQHYFDNHLHYESGGPFDYCTPMVEGFTVSGSDRWIDYQDEQAAFPLDSDPGRAEVEDAWAATQDYMEKNLENIIDAIEVGDSVEDVREKVMEDDMLPYCMGKIGGYSTDKFLYVQGWNFTGIDSYRGWNHVQEMMDEQAESDEHTRWVVPLDVHH